jgi:thiol peroxidase
VADSSIDPNELLYSEEPPVAQTHLKGSPVQTSGDLPTLGSPAPAFTLVRVDLTDTELRSYPCIRSIG